MQGNIINFRMQTLKSMFTPFHKINGHTLYIPGLTQDMIVFDLGANRAKFSQAVRARYGGSFYMVEANPLLVKELRKDKDFTVFGYALSASEGILHFNLSHNDRGSSILALPAENIFGSTLKEIIEIPSCTLPSLIQETGVPKIDLLKIDIEGAEVEVLQSLDESHLSNIGQITVEFHSHPVFGLNQTNEDVYSIISKLRECHFSVFDFSRPHKMDVLFLNQNWYKISPLAEYWWKIAFDYIPASLRELRRKLKYLRKRLH